MFGKEPAVFFGGIGEILRAIVPLALIFGWVVWSDVQTGAVMLVINVVLSFLITMFTRSQTVSTVTADAQIVAAKDLPASTTPSEAIRLSKEATK